MKKNILILGYFGYETNQLDGQTIKTRDIEKLLEKEIGKSTYKIFDTQSLKVSKLNFFKLLWLLFWCKNLVYLPGQNNLVGLRGLINLLIKYKGLNVYYLVVGGWLSNFLKKNKDFIPLLKTFRYIGVESNALKDELKSNHGLQNVDFFPNFRIHSFAPDISVNNECLKLVFMARVVMEKGLDTLFDSAKIIDENKYDITITFYGPIDDKDKDYFLRNIKNFNCVEYKGSLEPKEINQVISEYDLLVLPTYYEGEGFPGSILDAYISGLPVIVTNWKFLPEFVIDGETGYVINSLDEFIEKIIALSKNKQKLLRMKQAAHQQSFLYSADVAWKKLSNYLDN